MNIDLPSIIGFGGSLIWIVVFILIFRKTLNVLGFILVPILFYTLSLTIGILSKEIYNISDAMSANIAGFFAPIGLLIMLLFWFHFFPRNVLTKHKVASNNSESVIDWPLE